MNILYTIKTYWL